MDLNPVTLIINLHKSEMENGGAAYIWLVQPQME